MLIKGKLQKLSVCVVAILSLLASAVSACACNHHESKPVTAVASCHSETHEAVSAERVTNGDTVETGCNCFVKDPTPFILAKSESKKLKVQKKSPVTIVETVDVESIDLAIVSVSLLSSVSRQFYAAPPSRSAPARGPPVL
ncbi:MAG TPA: hypothetical protein PLL77_09315 [Pyrinomonadaceae bacterium]|nr:hypothetical protein [Pyrinomonadaceae bacterium]